jgi:hypothetical protein
MGKCDKLKQEKNMSQVKIINELEFIGESLPKINFNFDMLEKREISLESTETQYKSLSSLYVTNKSTSKINFIRHSEDLITSLSKSSLINYLAQNSISESQIIYPVPIYVRVYNNDETVSPTLTFYRTAKINSGEIAVMNVKIPLAKNDTVNGGYYDVITFNDLGYYDWRLALTTANSFESTVAFDVKYFTP